MARKKKGRGGGGAGAAAAAAAAEAFSDSVRESVQESLAEHREQVLAEGMEQVNLNADLPLTRLARKIREGLRKNGTNVAQNDGDPLGDGDQSVIQGRRQRQHHRDLFATGGDLHNCVHPVNTLSPFATAVLTGNVPRVEEMLKEAEAAATRSSSGGGTGNNNGDGDSDDGTPAPELVRLLESRETSMRLSPILIVVSMGKNLALPGAGGGASFMDDSHAAVAKLLLRYGARPDARDVVGKTVFHYGAGAFATPMSMKVADLCLKAQEGGSNMFGKKVSLAGLADQTMNGRVGVALGFDVDSGRRTVSLPSGGGVGGGAGRRKVAVKPENLRLAGAGDAGPGQPLHQQQHHRPSVRLCDVQDRLGGVSLIEVIMQERVDVAKFLLERRVRIDIPDCDGCSPLSMAMKSGAQLGSQVCRLVNEYATLSARRDRRKLCSNCGKDEKDTADGLSLCSSCKGPRYCSRECQIQHWRASHAVECRAIQEKKKERVVLERPPDSLADRNFFTVSHSPDGVRGDGGRYRMPRGVQAKEKFTIKVQAAGTRAAGSLLIYNEARDCSFFMIPAQAGYRELFDAVKAEKATGGTKTYMKAYFDEEGKCVAFPGDTSIHTW